MTHPCVKATETERYHRIHDDQKHDGAGRPDNMVSGSILPAQAHNQPEAEQPGQTAHSPWSRGTSTLVATV